MESRHEEEAAEHYRIHVPNPDSEIIVGEGPSGFVGIVHRVSNGGMFFGAGGYGFGIGSADSTYEGFRRAHTALGIAISGAQLVSQFVRAGMMAREANALSVTVNGIAFGLGPVAGTIGAIATGGLTSAEGTIGLYGEKTVAIASPITANMTAGLAASVTGGVAASINSIVSATVNAASAGVFGAYAATVAGHKTQIVGDAETTVSSRSGKTTVEGTTVQIGNRSGVEPGMAYRGFMTGGQAATANVEVVADKSITLAPGKTTDRVRGTTTKIVATTDQVHMQAESGALTLNDKHFLARGDGGGLTIAASKVRLWHSRAAVLKPFNKLVSAAEATWVAAHKAADATTETIGGKTLISAAVGVALSSVALGVAIAKAKGMSQGATAGVTLGSQAAGGVLGALGTWSILTAVESKLTQVARETLRTAADTAYQAVCDAAQATNEASADAIAALPVTPKIDLQDGAVVIKMGLTKINVTAGSIAITTPPGTAVDINGQTFKNLVPGALEVG